MKTIAEKIIGSFQSTDDVFDFFRAKACEIADNYEADYENDIAYFEFEDGSIMRLNAVSMEIHTYKNRGETYQ